MHAQFIPAKALASKEVFAAFLKDGSVAPYVSEEITRDKWVWFGADNLAPESWREKADNSAPLARCIDMSILFLTGKGVEFVNEKGEVIPEAQKRFQEWVSETTEEEFMSNTFADVALLNAFAWDISPLGSVISDGIRKVGRLRHRDAMRFRVGKPDPETGKISNYWWSYDWALYRRKKRYNPKPLEIFDPNKVKKESTLYVKTYKQGKDFYGEPWYLAAMEAIEVCVQVPKYNRSQMDNGFAPVVHLHLTTEKDEADIAKMYDAIKESYFGVTGDGLFLTFGRSGEVVELKSLPRGDHAGELDAMYTASEQIVVKTYLGAGGAVLYGLDGIKSGMDGASAAMQQAAQMFQRTFVEPHQRIVTRELTKLMNLDGIPVWDCRIKPLEIVDARVDEVQDRQAYMRAVTVDEHRVNRLGLPPLSDVEGAEGEEGGKLLIAAGSQSADPNADPNTAKE